MLERLHHVQLAMPRGQEDAARAFYVDVLGLAEMAKPPVLAGHDPIPDHDMPGYRRIYADPFGNRLEFPQPE